MLGLTAAPAILWPATYGILARRFVAPWVDLERVGRFVITVAPGDRIAAIGADLSVAAEVRPRFGNLTPPESAWLEWTESGGNGAWHRVAMPVEEASPPVNGQAFVRGDAAAADRLIELPGRQWIGAQPELSDHRARAAGRRGAGGNRRAAGLYQARRREASLTRAGSTPGRGAG